MSKKLTPKLRFPEFRKAGDWATQELGPKTIKVGSGITPTGGEKVYKKSGRPFIRSQNVGWSELLLDDVAYIDEDTHQSFDGTELRVDDVLLNITGASIGRSAIVDSRIAAGNVNQHVCIIRVKPDELSPVLLNQYLVSREGQKQIDSFQAGGNRQGLNFAQIRSFLLPLPASLAEQQKIADCLSSLDDLIAAEGRKLESLRAYKKGLMQQLFPRPGETRPRLRFPEFRTAGEWEEKKMSGCFSQIRNGFVGTATPFYVIDGIPYLQGKNVKKGLIDPTGLVHISKAFHDKQKKSQLKSTDILMVQSGHVGECAVVGPEFEGANCHALLVMTPREQQDSSYFVHCFGSDYGRRFIDEITTGNTIKHILASDMNAVELLVPTFAEQQRIAACLSSLEDRIAAQLRMFEGLKQHKKGLMQQLFPSAAEE